MNRISIVSSIALIVCCLSVGNAVAQDSNRNEIRSKISAGGWNPVYGELVNEAEYVKMGAALYTGSIGAYFSDYLERTIDKMIRTAPDVGRRALVDTIKRAFKDKGKSFSVGKIGVKAGIATYRRWKYVSTHVPTGKTEKYKIYGPFNTWTWGYRPEMKLVKKRISLPNHHQPYVAFRLYASSGSSSSSSSSSSSTSSKRIDYTIKNETKRTVKFQLPSGKWYELKPGEKRKYFNTKSNPVAYIPNSKSQRYKLSSGNWHIIELGSNRVGFGKW